MKSAPQEPNRTLSDAELAQLRARSTEDLCAIARLQEEAASFGAQRDDADIPLDAAEREAYLSVQEQSFSLLYELLCREELLWYETRTPADVPETENIDLCRTLRHFLNMTDQMTGEHLHIGAHEIPSFLYARVKPERLVFVLLHQLIQMWSGDLTLNVMNLFVGKAHGEIRIELLLRRDAEAGTEPLPEHPLPGDTLHNTAAAMTERFCQRFGARLLRQDSEAERRCILSFPASGMLDTMLQLRSDGAPPIAGRHTAYHAVLSCLIPAEVLLWGDLCDI